MRGRNVIDVDVEISTTEAGKVRPGPKRPGLSAAALAYLSRLSTKPKEAPPPPTTTASHPPPKEPTRKPPSTSKIGGGLLLSASDLSLSSPAPSPRRAQPVAQISGPKKADLTTQQKPQNTLSLSEDNDDTSVDGPIVALHSFGSLDIVSDADSLILEEAPTSIKEQESLAEEIQSEAVASSVAEEIPSEPEPSYASDFHEDEESSAKNIPSISIVSTVQSSGEDSTKTSTQTKTQTRTPPPKLDADSPTHSETVSSSSTSSSYSPPPAPPVRRSARRTVPECKSHGTQTETSVREELTKEHLTVIKPLPSLIRLLSLDLAQSAADLAEPQKSCLASLLLQHVALIESSARIQSESAERMDQVLAMPPTSQALSSAQIRLLFQEIDESDEY